MGSALTLRIAGVGLRLAAGRAELLRRLGARYEPFRAPGGADLRLHVDFVDRPLGPDREEPRVCAHGRGVRIQRHDLEAELGGRGGWARILARPSPLDSLLRIALSFALIRRGGFLCHAAAVDGWLFPGPSGAGKSTLGRVAPRDRLLADELVGVRAGRLYATPFWGDFRPGRDNGNRPLEGIFFLDRRAPRGARPLGKGEALLRLLRCVLYFGDDAAAGARLLERARRLVERVPAFTLSYDARRWGFRDVEACLREALE
ncbi:MAG TPA: hypothetical protein VNO22_12080 [Planctomycetota bacterium]|nr:hypothetical protein [Planctomycetota bacterium]